MQVNNALLKVTGLTGREYVEKAFKGGWDDDNWESAELCYLNIPLEVILLDPKSWRAVGEVEGWGEMCNACHNGWHYNTPVLDEDSTGNTPKYKPSKTGCDYATSSCPDTSEGWLYKMHRLIDTLSEEIK